MDTKKVIGSRINEALAFSNKKQKELAAHLGVPDNTISYFCSGKRVPNAEQIIEISKFLGVSADFLLGLSGNKTTEPKLQSACEYTGLSDKAINKLVEKINGITVFGHILEDVLCDDSFYDIIFELQSLSRYNIRYAYYYLMVRLFIADENKSEEEINTMYTWVEDMDTKCDVSKYNISKLTEKFSENYDLRKLYEEMNNATLVKTVCTYYNITKDELKEDYKKHEYIVAEGIKARYLEYHRKQRTIIHEIKVCRKSNDIDITEVENDGEHNPPKE